MTASGNDDTFPVRSCPGHGFYAGQLPTSRQVLITKCAYGFIVVYEFDEGGALLNKTRADCRTLRRAAMASREGFIR